MKWTISGTFLIVLTCLNTALIAQNGDVSLTVYTGGLIPVGQFSEKIGNDPQITRRFGFDYGKKVGLAAPGYVLGAELCQNVLNENLDWVISTKLLMNSTDNSEIESFFQNVSGDSIDTVFENGSWINIPVFTGFSYYLYLGESSRLSATIQVGINITKQPHRKVIVDGTVVEETTFRFTPDFGFELGVGFELKRKYTLGVRYINLSAPRYEGTRTLNEAFFTSIPKRKMNVDGDERPISMIMVFLGYTL